MEHCIFCKIVSGQIPCSKLYEDNDVLAFLDIKPAAKGHALIIPKRHYDTLIHTPIPVLDKMIEAAKKVAVSQEKMLGSTGCNFLVNNGKDAGQVVSHTHLHVIPRSAEDGLHLSWTPTEYGSNEMNEHQAKLREFLK